MIYVNIIFSFLLICLAIFVLYDIFDSRLRKVGVPHKIELGVLIFLYVVALLVALGMLYVCIRFMGYVPFELFL